MSPSTANILTYFDYEHLPEHLQEVSRPFSVLAHSIAERGPHNPSGGDELTVALRKLLESKDAAVRADLG